MNDGTTTKDVGRMVARTMTIVGALALGACGGLDWGGTDESGGDGTGGSCPEGNNGCDCKSNGSCNGDLICDEDSETCVAGLPGHWVQCAYQGTWSPISGGEQQHCGRQESIKMCINPNEWDANSNGELEGSELKAFCETRCDPGWNVTYGLKPKWNFYGCGTETLIAGYPPDDNQDFWSCEAINPDLTGGLPAPKIAQGDRYACEPYKDDNGDNKYPNYLETWGLDVEPAFETDFASSSSGNELEIWITGTELVPSSYNLNVQYSLDDCEPVGSQIHCSFVLANFELTMPSITFGDYDVEDVALVLNQRVAAEVVFSSYGPAPGYWIGTFELSETTENAVGTNLFWTQINRVKETSIDNALHLGNTDDALGGIDEIYGVVDITPSGSTFRLIGYGDDAITGGDWASVDFDLIDELLPLRER